MWELLSVWSPSLPIHQYYQNTNIFLEWVVWWSQLAILLWQVWSPQHKWQFCLTFLPSWYLLRHLIYFSNSDPGVVITKTHYGIFFLLNFYLLPYFGPIFNDVQSDRNTFPHSFFQNSLIHSSLEVMLRVRFKSSLNVCNFHAKVPSNQSKDYIHRPANLKFGWQ